MNYQKTEAMNLLKQKFDWEWYGGHHLDNWFTAFYHRYFMPKRFGIDQRLLGYSALIRSNQMTQKEGLELMSQPPYNDPKIIEIVNLVKKRLEISNQEFEDLMQAPRKTYRSFKTYKKTFERMRPFFWLLYKFDLVPKSFYMKYTIKDNIKVVFNDIAAPVLKKR